MKAVKANKVYTISEMEKQSYINDGFDICNDDGEIIAYGKGKTVPYEEFLALQKELEAAKAPKKEKKEKTGDA